MHLEEKEVYGMWRKGLYTGYAAFESGGYYVSNKTVSEAMGSWYATEANSALWHCSRLISIDIQYIDIFDR